MKKKSILAMALTIALAALPMAGQSAMAAENDSVTTANEGIAVANDEISTASTGSDVVKGAEGQIELPAPTLLEWADNWRGFSCDLVEGSVEGDTYSYEVYKDGELYLERPFNFVYSSNIDSGKMSFDGTLNREINESGTYKFRVRLGTSGSREGEHFSQWSEWSSEKVYVRPDKSLGTTVGYWSDEKTDTICFSSVEGACGYEITLYATRAGQSEEFIAATYVRMDRKPWDVGTIISASVSPSINGIGAGKYRVRIRMLSPNIDEVANGEFGEWSAYWDTEQTAKEVSDLLSEAMSADDVSDARNQVIDTITKSALRTSMQTDAAVREQISDLESRYVAEAGITVDEPAVSSKAGAYVNASEISVVGAGLNAAAGNKVQLEIDVPSQEAFVPERYNKSVQLEIRLNRDGTSVHNLDIPVSVTMPVPTGVSAEKLVLLHYHADGTVETIHPLNNGDGTLTFTVDKFSTFVFAEEGQTSGGSGSVPTETPVASATVTGGSIGYREKIVDVNWNAVNSSIDEGLQAGEQNVKVLTGTKYIVPAATIAKLAGKDVTLMMQTGSGLALSISGKDVKQTNADVPVTLSFLETIPWEAKYQIKEGASLIHEFAMTEKTAYPVKVDIHMNLGKENVGKVATLYYYDESTNSLQPMGSFVINEDGRAMFAISHGDEYLVAVTDEAQAPIGLPHATYIVTSGDTLSGIARKNGVSLAALIQINPQIKNSNKIYPGQVINLR